MEHRQFSILVVEDEPDVIPLIKQRMSSYIGSREYAFQFASDGLEALELLSSGHHVDLVVTEINTPGVDGLTLLEYLADVRPDTKAIVISAHGDMKNIRSAMNRGAFDFITKPFDFDDFELTIKRTQAHMKQWADVRNARTELVAMQHELELAGEIQKSILPVAFPSYRNCEIVGSVKPARNVSGDFLDLLFLDTVPAANGQIGLVVADVSGKGIPAALFMTHSRTLLKGAAIGLGAPGKVLDEVNARLAEGNRSFMFVSILYVVFDDETGILTYANGGHCNPLIIHTDGSCTELQETGGVVLGLSTNFTYAERKATLEPGESLLLFSDGVIEARNRQGDEFGIERLTTLFVEVPPDCAEQVSARITRAVAEFTGDTPQHDDITLLALHRKLHLADDENACSY